MVAIGIDLGTTYSCVAVYKNGREEVIANTEYGSRITPSVVAFTDTGSVVGAAAYEEMRKENIIYEAKRLMGRYSTDPTVARDMKNWPFKVTPREDKSLVFQVHRNGQPYFRAPEDVSALVLAKMKQSAEAALGQVVTDAVITVPAYFNGSQRQATIKAGKCANLNVLRIVNEPTAAAIAYAVRKGFTQKKKILVYDLGGGTFDVSVLEMIGGEVNVLAVAGDDHLGGADFNNRLFDHFAQEIQLRLGQDIRNYPKSVARLRHSCEAVKIRLTGDTRVTMGLEYAIGSSAFQTAISRSTFEDLCGDLFAKTLVSVRQALSDANLHESQIDEVVLVGGSTRIPKIQELVAGMFGYGKISKDIHPDEAVAVGAAILAAKLSGDQCCALKTLTVKDVTSLTFNMKVADGMMFPVIMRNSPIPVSKSELFVTIYDNQLSASVSIYQGERPLAKDNLFVGECTLPMSGTDRAGEGKVELTLSVDENGMLKITATDLKTKKTVKAEVNYETNCPTKDKIVSMINDKTRFAADDAAAVEKGKAMGAFRDLLLKTKHDIEDRKFVSKAYYGSPAALNVVNAELQWVQSEPEINIAELCQRTQKINLL